MSVEGQFAFNEVEMIVRAARSGFGLGFVMEDRVQEDIATGRLVGALNDLWTPLAGYHLYDPSRRQPSGVFAVLVDAQRYCG